MIRLELKDYCHDCVNFEAEVEKPQAWYDTNNKIVLYTDTIVRCAHAMCCAHIAKYIMEGYKEDEGRTSES